jgi:hypothetical protein
VAWRDACDAVNGTCTYAHRANMLSAGFKVIGIGHAFSSTSTFGSYWTTDFGGFADAILSYGAGTILVNGSFESASLGSAAWNAVQTRGGWFVDNASRSNVAPRGGTDDMHVRDPDPGHASVAQIAFAAPGIAYTFTAWSERLSGRGTQSLYLEFLDHGYARVGVHAVPAASGPAYAAASIAAVAPPLTRYVRVFAYGGTASGAESTYAYDSASLSAQ